MKIRYFIVVFICSLLTNLCAVSAAEPSAAKRFQPFVEDSRVSGGVVLVADGDKILAKEAFGYADLETKRPMEVDSLFWIASQTKPITAAAILILRDEGKLDLDDPVEKYLPEFEGIKLEIKEKNGEVERRDPVRKFTIRDLLTHTSGLIGGHRYPDVIPLSEIVRILAREPLGYDPGTDFKYAGAGYSTAGRIIEVVSGRSYADFLQKRIFDPLKMNDTTFWPTRRQQTTRLAFAYHVPKDGENGSPIRSTYYRVAGELDDRQRPPFPGGGLFSTAEDVSRFLRMLLNRGELDGIRILSENAVAEMARLQNGDGKGGLIGKDPWGLGVEIVGKEFGHEGAFKTEGWVDPERKIVRVLMLQIDGKCPYIRDLKNAFADYTDDIP